MSDYIEQWNRLERYYKKVLDLELNEQKFTSDECLEEMYLFFENCLKLRNWIKNSDYVGDEVKERITELFKKDKDLSVGMALANRRKHLKPDNRIKYGDSSIVSHIITVQVPVINVKNKQLQIRSEQPTKAKYNWGLKSGGEKFELINLAKICMGKVENFMRQNQLIS